MYKTQGFKPFPLKKKEHKFTLLEIVLIVILAFMILERVALIKGL